MPLDLLHRIALASLRGLTTETASLIIDRFGSDIGRFFTLPTRDLEDITGSRSRTLDTTHRTRALTQAQTEADFVTSRAIRAIFFTDPAYPRRLLQCPDAPLMLYAIGDTDFNNSRILSIVGTRHATPYGTTFVETLVKELAATIADPLIIVSGLAYGIDITAHRAALAASVPTAAVLAHGLNTIYPAPHRDTAVRMIRAGGTLLTDYRSADTIHRGNFLARNRIVAGLADALLVAESDTKGGAMVTARLAAAYSREVFALPGRTSDPYSRGCNTLIANHTAHLVTSPDDIIDTLRWPRRPGEGSQPTLFPHLTPDEQTITDILTGRGQASLTELLQATDLPVHTLMSILIDLETRGHILALPGSNYRPA